MVYRHPPMSVFHHTNTIASHSTIHPSPVLFHAILLGRVAIDDVHDSSRHVGKDSTRHNRGDDNKRIKRSKSIEDAHAKGNLQSMKVLHLRKYAVAMGLGGHCSTGLRWNRGTDARPLHVHSYICPPEPFPFPPFTRWRPKKKAELIADISAHLNARSEAEE